MVGNTKPPLLHLYQANVYKCKAAHHVRYYSHTKRTVMWSYCKSHTHPTTRERTYTARHSTQGSYASAQSHTGTQTTPVSRF